MAICAALVLLTAQHALSPGLNRIDSRSTPYLAALYLAGLLALGLVAVAPTRARTIAAASIAWILAIVFASTFEAMPMLCAGVAGVVLPSRPEPEAPASPNQAHEFSPLSDGWFSRLAPLWWSQAPFGGMQRAQRKCRFCGRIEDDEVHGEPPNAASGW